VNPLIAICTYHSHANVAPLMVDVEGFSFGYRVIATCQNGSASVNRNYALQVAENCGHDSIVMIDDATRGFHLGWADRLIEPLSDKNVLIVSARLMNADGTYGAMMFAGSTKGPLSDVEAVPTACVAFRLDHGIKFHEGFIFSGFEDTWFCDCMKVKNQAGRFVINNNVKIVHINEQKGQSTGFAHNKAEYERLKCQALPAPN